MDNKLIIDLAFALVLVLGAVFGAKRGLFRSLMALAAIVIALIGASLLTDLLTEPVTNALMPRAEKSVEEWFAASDETAKGEAPQLGVRPLRRMPPRVKRRTTLLHRTRRMLRRMTPRSR